MRVAASPSLPAPPTTSSASDGKGRIVVAPWKFILCWWSVLVVHLVCVFFIGLLGAVHAFTATPEIFRYSAPALQTPRIFLVLATRTFFVVVCLHLFAIGRMVVCSIRRRQLCFYETSSITERRQPSRMQSVVATLVTPIHLLRQIWNKYFGTNGVFGLNGPHFDVAFRVREILEALSQTYQAYYLSASLSILWINHLAVAIIVIGCGSAPLTHMVGRRNVAVGRLSSLVVDMVLDLVGSVGIPLVIAFTSIADFDWQARMFPKALTYDNVWVAKAVSQARLLYVCSTPDYLSTLILQLSVLGALVTIASAVERKKDPETTTTTTRKSKQLVVASPSTHQPLAVDPTAWPPVRASRVRYIWASIDIALFMWGILVLVTHIHANRSNTEDTIPSCALGTHSWFATKPGCTVLSVNCHRLGITGTAQEITTIMDPLDRSTIKILAIMHCPGLVVPDTIQEFIVLRSIELTNVTLVSWPLTAAVHSAYHTKITHISMGHVNFTEFPTGLLHADLPLSLVDVQVSYTNITVLPESVGEYWSNRHWLRLQFEHTALTTLPASFSRVAVYRLSLIGNEIASIPDDMFASQTFTELFVSGNPLHALPATIGETSRLQRVYAEHTEISTTPSWWDDWYKHHSTTTPLDARLFGSELCDAQNQELTPTERGEMCAVDTGTSSGAVVWDIAWRYRPVE